MRLFSALNNSSLNEPSTENQQSLSNAAQRQLPVVPQNNLNFSNREPPPSYWASHHRSSAAATISSGQSRRRPAPPPPPPLIVNPQRARNRLSLSDTDSDDDDSERERRFRLFTPPRQRPKNEVLLGTF